MMEERVERTQDFLNLALNDNRYQQSSKQETQHIKLKTDELYLESNLFNYTKSNDKKCAIEDG